MTFARSTALTLALVGAFGLGVWTAPHLRDMNATPAADIVLSPEPEARMAPAARTSPRHRTTAPAAVVLAASAEPVRDHVKPLLTWGTDTRKAAEGFTSAEQFVAVAYAANNTEVPFMLLKHRVLNEKQSLADAIRASKPDLDAALEADRAWLEARADLRRIGT